MYPNQDAPEYLPGFGGTLAVLVVCIVSYLTLPLWLMREAQIRKKKTGHAIPLQAMEDAERSMVSAAAHDLIHQINEREEKEVFSGKDIELGDRRVEHIEERK